MPELLITNGTDQGKHIHVKTEVFLGRVSKQQRTNANQIYINDSEVSRRHCRVFKSDGFYYVQDLNSMNGVVMQGCKIRPGVLYKIKDGDELIIGTTKFLYIDEHHHTKNLHHTGYSSKSIPSFTIVEQTDDDNNNVSAVLDASKIMSELKLRHDISVIGKQEMIRRLGAMAQVSISLGSIKDREELLNKITDNLFTIFSNAECIHIMFTDHKTNELVSVKYAEYENRTSHAKNLIISRSIIDEVISHKKSLLIMDALGDDRFKHKESVVNLEIRSVMCVPLLYEDRVLGLIQITSQKKTGLFTKEDLDVLTGIAAQIAISLKNSQLFTEIEQLFEGFVYASVQAIEARDPTTAGHSFRVAEYTEYLSISVDKHSSGKFKDITFNSTQLQEIRYAALLHDFGKVGVREGVLTKEKKLYGHEIDSIKMRFKYARACMEKQYYQQLVELHISKNLTKQEFLQHKIELEVAMNVKVKQLEEFMEVIKTTNEPAVTYNKIPEKLNEIANSTILGINNEEVSLINSFEFSKLSLARGSLNPEERIEIESHVNHTYAFLTLIPWSADLNQIPKIAYAHHEKLDGSGYPRGLKEDQIPLPSKIMTIADIYDALTAGDRPYKQGLSTDKALDILHVEATENKIDSGLLEIFIESKSYLTEQKKY